MDETRTNNGTPAPEPFGAHLEAPVPGGRLSVHAAGPPATDADAVVLGIHGITSSHMIYRTVARELSARMPGACVLAPDLRGRGQSAGVGAPYGVARHAADMVAVLDHVGAERVVAVGHSMGAYVAARMAADHPDRVGAVVLLDAGLPFPRPPEDPEAVFELVVGPALERLHLRFDSVAQYVEGWRRYPAFVHAWNEDVEAYARYDMVSDGRSVGCVVSEEAVRFDGYDLLTDEDTRTALDRVRAPIRVMRAARGLRDDNQRMLPDVGLEPFRRAHPEVVIEDMPDVNHYTMVLGAGHGPQLVAAAIEAAAREPARGSAAPPAW